MEIDVSECNLRHDNIDGCCFEDKNHSIRLQKCKSANCYYKQLKRKEQECEEYKNHCKQQIVDVVNIVNERNTYKQALDEIEKYAMNVICDDCVNGLCDNCTNNHILQLIQKVKEQ